MPYLTHKSEAFAAPGLPTYERRQSQHSLIAKTAIMSNIAAPHRQGVFDNSLAPPTSSPIQRPNLTHEHSHIKSFRGIPGARHAQDGGFTLSDTPISTAPASPNIPPRRQNSGDNKARRPPTTLNIPGLTKSRASPDGKISQRDVGSKLVIVMVGLPARGKSYITKKMARYLNWLQHDTQIFNVGSRRRIAAGGHGNRSSSQQDNEDALDGLRRSATNTDTTKCLTSPSSPINAFELAAQILTNGGAYQNTNENSNERRTSHPDHTPGLPELHLPEPSNQPVLVAEEDAMDQSAAFFDPNNRKAALIREQCAVDTLNELLDYILDQGGAVGILDATNSTLQRRKLIMNVIRERAGPDLNVLFVESLCVDTDLLERNMRLKLSGPDYRDKDPEASLIDFKKRVAAYEKAYVPLGEYEEKNNMAYVQMIDVGRKVISHQIKGFLSAQAVYYLLNFNLAPRQIWITRHGQSIDNVLGKIGGDSDLSGHGLEFGEVLTKFINHERTAWDIRQIEKEKNTHMPPLPGDHTPPNPHMDCTGESEKNFCVWTSMMKRSIQTAQHFDEDEFDIKQMRMLDELFSGYLEGLTYSEIRDKHPSEFAARRTDKLGYRYPGPGGEGYLDVINRLRPVIVELERMTDHVLLIGHRSVARILLAYFMGLSHDKITDLDLPLGVLYCLEPKPYGVDFKAFRYNGETAWFDHEPDYELRKGESYIE